ncbi:MAG: hypothetical protein P8074_23185 [Anaerolineales bacterium]
MDTSLKNDRISHPQRLALQIILIPLAIFFISLAWARNAQSSNQSLIQSDNPAPVLTDVDPAQVTAGSQAFTITITGSSFITQSVVLMDSAPLMTTFISTTQLLAAVPVESIRTYRQAQIQVENSPPVGGLSDSRPLVILPPSQIFLPLALGHFPPATAAPTLQPIANADYDNRYTVSWRNPATGKSYVLEESRDPTFTQPLVVYQGPNLFWIVPAEGKLPGTYYYRARTVTASGESPWSSVRSVHIYPLFVGLKARYDGMGSVRGSNNYDIGWYETIVLDALSGVDGVQAQIHAWYDPNPHGFEESYKTSFFSVNTGELKSSTAQRDPAWKWEYAWKLAYDVTFADGSTIQIDGQNFTVRGPKSGTTSYGRSITYWEFVNQKQFLIYDSGDVKQVSRPGEAILRYDAGASRLLIYNDITRHIYYQDEDIGESIQYVAHLTAANSLPGSPPVEE